jgi:hypothetical protein
MESSEVVKACEDAERIMQYLYNRAFPHPETSL